MRDLLPARLKLQITLRYLASGDSFASLQYLYRVPKCTISTFLPEVCGSTYSVLKNYIKVSNSIIFNTINFYFTFQQNTKFNKPLKLAQYFNFININF